ncbi:LacI family DNA-binding transcriptional regulator [Diplocloster agilis]|uniref:LacI family DNA-binding transcriptional regulator n=1 Tax=Diplocloster agilis TaxID=2850323 RepID=A0A949JZX2_9FIRM|nr:LacI family DNA-binding transcriptional regulator [Diplocloster agilis]MBU9738308.1 LacI family DNA-binding transcriptional regulator [Diplocloster agilis]
MQKKVTIYDVAERLGISTATVNRAMNEKGSISDKTKRLVQETAREMGYHPSKSASSLKRNPRRIAVLLPNTIHGYQAEVERGVHKAAEELAEYSVECEVFEENDEDMEVFIRRLQEISDMNFDGIIILPPFDEAQMSRAVQDLREQKKQYYVTVTSDLQDSGRILSVQSNGIVAGRMAAELLGWKIPQGSKAAIVIGQGTTQAHRNVIEGFQSELHNFHLMFAGVYEHHDDPEQSYRLADELLHQHPDIAGVYLGTANSVAFCKRLKELGMDRRIAVIASDIFPEIAQLMEEGTIDATIFQNPFQQGRIAFRYLYEYMVEGRRFDTDTIYLDPSIILRSNLCLFQNNLEQMKDGIVQ